ncbi:hypothetical protein QAD02_009553 [Eretmocerus hayati]|uniref:Uncharacterized protein n=1 Tax=Eretmocerus hayati TaxID=131215 RepID=A0ACC2NE51_9HYME|nr:hypothetical protein QAD02_009553 [Eretmocerus hayati]
MAPGGGHPQETGPAEPAHRQGGEVNPIPSPGVAQNGAGYPAVHSLAEKFRRGAAAEYGEAVDPLQLGAGPSSRFADVNANAPESQDAERQEAQHPPEEHDEGIAVEIEPIQDDDDFMSEFLQAMNVPQPSLRMVIRRRPRPDSSNEASPGATDNSE